jgi:hypothetical protein
LDGAAGGWLLPPAALAMMPIAVPLARTSRTVFRTRWRLRGGVGVGVGLSVWVVVVSDMEIP